MAPPTLTDSTNRIVALDILRGFALAGMILVHFHQAFRLTTPDIATWPGEPLSAWIIWWGIEGKAAATFAFLFGVGFAVLLRRAQADGRPIVALYLRRLLALALFGVAIEALTGYAILIHLAISGVALLIVRHCSVRTLLILAAAAAVATPLYVLGHALHDVLTGAVQPAAPALPPAVTYGEEVLRRLTAMRAKYVGWRALVPTTTLTLFLLGLAALRHGVFDEPRRHVRLIAGAMVAGLACWLLFWLVLPLMPEAWYGWSRHAWPIRYGMGLVIHEWLAFTYIGALMLLLAWRPAWTRRLAPVGLIGRMALTNYALQAAIIYAMRSEFGLGLALRPYYRVLGAFLLCAALALFSGWWLARFRYGPLEWVWRRLTYLRLRAPSSATPVGPSAATP